MEEIYAAMLLHQTKQEISEENLRKVLASAGAQVSDVKLKALVTALEGVNIDEAIKQAAFVPVAGAGATSASAEKKEEKAEEKEEAKEEAAAEGLASLFG